MNILKTKKLFTYMVVGALVMALSISCKSNEDPNSGDTKKEDQKTQERTLSYYAGDWWADPEGNGTEIKFITINTDGSFILIPANIQVPSSNITKKSDTNYSATVTMEGVSGELIFTFSNDTQGKYEQMIGGAVTVSIPINKK